MADTTSPLQRIAPHHKLFTIAAYLVALAFLCIFPSFDRRTEIEEHGLVAGYAEHAFWGPWPAKLKETISRLKKAPDIATGLDKALIGAELITRRMNFTTPAGVDSNLAYTLVPSARGDSREVLVLVIATDWGSGKKAVENAAWGLGIGVTIAEYLRQVPWLSRDVFVVFVDSSLPYGAGVRAWLRAYLGGASAVRRGVLRQAIVLDMPRRPSWLLMDIEGINGMLPNQDIVNAYLIESGKQGLPAEPRSPWDSILHTLRNGGVHSSHSPFLELQVPAFTVAGVRQSGVLPPSGRTSNFESDALVRSLEGALRDLSNNLQQLHHSFNFYFYTSPRRHVSNGLYLYPVFGMQLPLLSFLMTSSAYRDIRSFLLGLFVVAATMAVAGSPVFLLGTHAGVVHALRNAGLPLELPPQCDREVSEQLDEKQLQQQRAAATLWLSSGLGSAFFLGLLLRQYAFRVFSDDGEDSGCNAHDSQRSSRGVQLASPLWEAVRASSGFIFLVVLASMTIANWALAVPLTIVTVPVLVLARPFSIRRMPFRMLLLVAFLAGNAFLIAVPPAVRADLLGDHVQSLASKFYDFYHETLRPAVPRGGQPYLPTSLLEWLREGSLASAMGDGDLLVGLYGAARDFRCVGGMLFPAFCFAYWPLLVLLAFIGCFLPSSRATKGDEEGASFRQLSAGALLVLAFFVAAFVVGVLWRSQSSHGMGTIEW